MSDNAGISRCSFVGRIPGTDMLTVFVNKAGGSAGQDTGEVSAPTTQTTTKPARYVDVTPRSKTTTAGGPAVFTATVSDINGAPAQGVSITFTESGPGSFGTPANVVTDSTGRAQVRVDTTSGDAGDETITATIATGGTQCTQPAGAGSGASSTTPAGRCADTVTHKVVAPSSASPSTTPSRSATATATMTPSPSCKTTGVNVNTPTINATGLASVTVTGASPGGSVELQGYSQNHYSAQNFDNDPTPVDRSGVTDNQGTITFNDLRPASNTRVRARQAGCAYGDSAVINVRTTITLKVTRVGTRRYTFDVGSIPARPGGLIVSIYRITGQTCAAGVEPRDCSGEEYVAQTRVSSSSGNGSRTLTFDTSFGGREDFVLKTGQDAQNAPGRSNVRSLAIY